MDDIEDEEVQRGQRPWLPSSGGTGRGRGLLPAGLWPPDSEVVIGRSKVNPEVKPTGYGRPRGDAGAYPVDDPQSAGRALAGQCGCGSVGTARRDEEPRRPGSTGYSSPSGSVRSPAAKRILVQSRA